MKLKAGNSLNFEVNSTVNLNVVATDSANAQLVKPFTITVNDLPELAGSGGLVIGDGSASALQRSRVDGEV